MTSSKRYIWPAYISRQKSPLSKNGLLLKRNSLSRITPGAAAILIDILWFMEEYLSLLLSVLCLLKTLLSIHTTPSRQEKCFFNAKKGNKMVEIMSNILGVWGRRTHSFQLTFSHSLILLFLLWKKKSFRVKPTFLPWRERGWGEFTMVNRFHFSNCGGGGGSNWQPG